MPDIRVFFLFFFWGGVGWVSVGVGGVGFGGRVGGLGVALFCFIAFV